MKNRFREALLNRRATFGAWAGIGHAACVEIPARLGFEWVAVDLEHGGVDLESLAGLFRAIELHGAVPVARLPYCDTLWIKRTLDAGARGLIVPMVNDAGQAEHAVREAKYPPRGRRGYGFSRANTYGIDFPDYAREANDEIAVVVQIEHRDAIANLDGILAVEGVDAAFLGPLDLSGSFGKTAQMDCPEMVDALETFRACCRAHGMAAGIHVIDTSLESIARALREGYTMLALSADIIWLTAAARAAVGNARSAGAGLGQPL
jgi:2-keto-3-deoxy-L-rhamnonate aldolase RhmA